MEHNILYVVKGYEPQTVCRSHFPICDIHLLTPCTLPRDITFKIRHTPEYHRARFLPLSDGRFEVVSEAPIHGVAPGQFCVVYDAEHHRCYGSAEITV